MYAKITQDTLDEIKRRRNSGQSQLTVAKRMNLSLSSVKNADRAGYSVQQLRADYKETTQKYRRTPAKGKKVSYHRVSHVTARMVFMAKELAQQGKNAQHIASAVGVSDETFYKMLRTGFNFGHYKRFNQLAQEHGYKAASEAYTHYKPLEAWVDRPVQTTATEAKAGKVVAPSERVGSIREVLDLRQDMLRDEFKDMSVWDFFRLRRKYRDG